ncbi:polysaccharide deacetylase family protein [Agrobacterium rosae]|uniref:Chitooligosaccharide deacetylase n=1 Tax=Agrobacterium rosae TaxID=1972867 RepID=A0AAE5S0E0_9HYPH|nr:polysaccharide deacetylase family protein [Agrobacterium rosae]KAA3513271.1 polysaccharide deacetylase [Agrobacterium rosae]KAA3521245.1 polysaccharide deacetylase [Agrobacterium rosae]MCM2432927.1 polysaccharide deacetylase family protein [Agrobacterium rosae]MDX8328004.1 polysaccharide deacetylase family protein [Agrobacterium rosae]MQB48115.1 polysaccharide deacetylase [Agrobacterium rosae]
MLRSLFILCLSLLTAAPVFAQSAEKPKQLVMVSFDGAGDNSLWERSRAMAKEVNAHFTYFLACTLVMDRKTSAKSYQGPGKKAGRSNVGFGQSIDEVETRLRNIWAAKQEGHEIANHTCGHFDGGNWNEEQWDTEFTNFTSTMENAWQMIGKKDEEPHGWRDLVKGINGFRAPYLSQSDALTAAQKKHGFVYDATSITKGPAWPIQKDGIEHFGLPLIPEGPNNRPIIAMDYNLFVRHSMAIENRERSAEFEERAYQAFRAAFDKQYDGERVPLQLGFHFVKMNGGAYWNAFERLLREVCKKEDVACVSYAEAMPMIEARRVQKSEG